MKLDKRHIDDAPTFESIHRLRAVRRRKPKYKKKLPKCGGKHSYATFYIANTTRLNQLKAKPGLFLRIYKCPHGPHLHLTKRPRWSGNLEDRLP